MNYYRDFEPEVRKELHAVLQKGADRLTESLKDSGKVIEKNLFLMNAGGIVAILSFMGAAESVRKMQLPMLSLRYFVVGLILCGCGNAAGFFCVKNNVKKYLQCNVDFYENRITLAEWQQGANSLQKGFLMNLAFIFGSFSFLCFILGSLPALFLAFQ